MPVCSITVYYKQKQTCQAFGKFGQPAVNQLHIAENIVDFVQNGGYVFLFLPYHGRNNTVLA